MRAVISAVFVGSTTASLVGDCRSGLNQLQGQSDSELALSCRAAFAPAVCRGVSQSLGPQPWSHDVIEDNCAKFAASYGDMDMRGLEESLENKQNLDSTTEGKPPASPSTYPQTTAAPKKKEGLVGSLLDKLKEGHKEQKKDKPEPGPLAKLFGDKNKEKAESDKEKPDLMKKLQQAEKAAKLAKAAKNLHDKLNGKDESKSAPAKPGPLAKLFNKPAQLFTAPAVQPEPAHSTPSPMGLTMAAVGVSASAVLFFSVRRSRTNSVNPELEVVGVEERCVE